MRRWLLIVLLCAGSLYRTAAAHPLLLEDPALSATHIAFAYGGMIWQVPRRGGVAHPLITGHGNLTRPLYSPNGQWIAFTATYQGNTDVYVASAQGSHVRRLTYYPGANIAVGWTPNSQNVLFRSARYATSYIPALFTVPVTGGFPRELPLPVGQAGSFSPNGKNLAYVPELQWERFWQHYEGGQQTTIRIARLSDSQVLRIPHGTAEDRNPMWVGHHVYFLSNAPGNFTLYSYNVKTRRIRMRVPRTSFDIISANAGPGAIVFDRFGRIDLYDLKTGQTRRVPITLSGNIPSWRPRFIKAAPYIQDFGIAPDGVRAVFAAFGKIITVPARHGSIENLTTRTGTMDRDPAWSPNGRWIAYFSDRSGEYDLYVRPDDGVGAVRKITLGQRNAFYDHLRWSPDSRKLVFSDQKLNLWYVDLARKDPHPVRIATDRYASPLHAFGARWSPDSRWIAYTVLEPNDLHAIRLYSLSTHQSYAVTHGASDCLYPVFDPDGRYLYFTESTDTALSQGWLDMSSLDHPIRRSVYALVLTRRAPSPVAPRAGFPGLSKHAPVVASSKVGTPVPPVHIDFRGLATRRVVLPIPPANYTGLAVGRSGMLYLRRSPLVPMSQNLGGEGLFAVLRFDLAKRKLKMLVPKTSVFRLAADGRYMLIKEGSHWYVEATTGKLEKHKLPVGEMRVRINPRASWTEMYRDVWRIEHAFFYNPHFDGTPVNQEERFFARYLPGVGSRSGLNLLFREMLSYLAVGHMFVSGGREPHTLKVGVGLLGANYRIRHGRYQVTKILRGGTWNPDLYAPLAQPGLAIRAGDYLLAVNGHPLRATQNIYQVFQGLAHANVILTVGPHPSAEGAHTIVVKTLASEHALRVAAWVDHNIRVVNRLSHGQLGYVYLPNTGAQGFRNFNRYFFSQVNKAGVIIDERFNTGGFLSDYIIQYLKRRPMSLVVTRYGHAYIEPPEANFGPKVMIINRYSGSGGDALPWYFKMDHLGPLVGARTWGGLVGIGGYPVLMDGGRVTAPRWAVEGLHGHFPVEDHGITPTVPVFENPELMRKGQDPELDQAVAVALRLLKEHPLPHYHRAPYRNYHLHLPH
ncbi:MAG: S41 family peptidase [Gammaproteobacteria bacterium]